MRSFGSTLFFFGIGSCILYFLNFEFILLMWIDLWGPTIGWVIRIAMIVLGAILWVIGSPDEK